MSVPRDEERQRLHFQLALEAAQVPLEQVWLAYFGVGGMNGLVEIQAYLYGALSLAPLERDLLARALNETLDGLGVDGRRASYSHEDCSDDPQGPTSL